MKKTGESTKVKLNVAKKPKISLTVEFRWKDGDEAARKKAFAIIGRMLKTIQLSPKQAMELLKQLEGELQKLQNTESSATTNKP